MKETSQKLIMVDDALIKCYANMNIVNTTNK